VNPQTLTLQVDLDAVFGHDPDVFAQPVLFDRDGALQRLSDLIQDRSHVQVQRCLFVVGQQLPSEAEADGQFLPLRCPLPTGILTTRSGFT